MSVETLQQVWTVRRVLTWTEQRFRRSSLASPRLDAEILLGHCLQKNRVRLYLDFDQPLATDELARFKHVVQKRLSGTPVAYLTGQKEFFSLPLEVSPAVLIPRPETETLVELALRFLSSGSFLNEAKHETSSLLPVQVVYDALPQTSEVADETAGETPPSVPEKAEPLSETPAQTKTVVDVGTGSGAIALAIKQHAKNVRVLAVEKSPAALDIAKKNAERLGLQVEFLSGDLLFPVPETETLDLVCANLPYIPTGDIATLAQDVQNEPRMALDGGPDGLSTIARLCDTAAARLRSGGGILLEVGAGQAQAVEKRLRSSGFSSVTSVRDLAGIERVVVGLAGGL